MALRDLLGQKTTALRDKIAEFADRITPDNTITYTAEREPEPTPSEEDTTYEHQGLIDAIAYNETRGEGEDEQRYAFHRDSGVKELGRARGKYQVTDGELKTWAPIIMGKRITGDEFQKSPELQDEYMKKKIEMIKNDVPDITDEEILAIHNKGMTKYMDKDVRKKRIEDAKEYVDSGLKFLLGQIEE